MAQGFRIATFNLENLDDRPGLVPTIEERIRVLRPQLLRLEADILCLQEVNAQEAKGEDRRRLAALGKLLARTPPAPLPPSVLAPPTPAGPPRSGTPSPPPPAAPGISTRWPFFTLAERCSIWYAVM